MVNREDIRTLNRAIQGDPEGGMGLIEALDELEELYDLEQRAGVTVDDAEFEAAQKAVKEAVAVISNHADDMVDRTDRLEDDEGNDLRTLPNPALARDGPSTDLPSGGN